MDANDNVDRFFHTFLIDWEQLTDSLLVHTDTPMRAHARTVVRMDPPISCRACFVRAHAKHIFCHSVSWGLVGSSTLGRAGMRKNEQ